jgi:ubiquinone/menaquinone biosynthesis C-methylase UbiE
MPPAGRIAIGSAEPLRYLAASVLRWHTEVRLEDALRQVGFETLGVTVLTGGIVTITLAQKL